MVEKVTESVSQSVGRQAHIFLFQTFKSLTDLVLSKFFNFREDALPARDKDLLTLGKSG